jgi:hypothetical protein
MRTPRTTRHGRRKRVSGGAADRDVARQKVRGIGRIIGIGALALLGMIVVLGIASLAALLAGYEPPRHEITARLLRRFAGDYRAQLPNRLREIAIEPGAEQIRRGQAWIRNRIG